MRLYQEDKRPTEALAVCDVLLKAEPDSYRALYQLGRMVALTGQQLDRGAAALRRAVTLTPGADDPARAHAYNRLGQILEAKGDVAGSRTAYETCACARSQAGGSEAGAGEVGMSAPAYHGGA